MLEFINNNAMYIGAVIAVLVAYIFGKNQGKLDALEFMSHQQAQIDSRNLWSAVLNKMGGNHEQPSE